MFLWRKNLPPASQRDIYHLFEPAFKTIFYIMSFELHLLAFSRIVTLWIIDNNWQIIG